MKRMLSLAVLFAIVSTPLASAEPDLKVGSDIPPLHIAKWVKGDAVDLSQAKPENVYVVEFWATWCPPCRASIPHLSELQEHFKDKHLKIIAITDEEKRVVKKFLSEGWDAKMRFIVAIDKKGKSGKAWMEAAEQEYIPTAFVVKGGKILWIGSSTTPEMDMAIAEACGDKEYAAKMKNLVETQEKFFAAMEEEKWPEAIKLIDKITSLKPDMDHLKVIKYTLLAAKIKDAKAAAAYGQKLVNESENTQALNSLSWGILTEEPFEGARDLKLAMIAAEKANTLSEKKDAAIIDTYARALMMTGDLKNAIKWQKKAVKVCESERMKEDLEKTLNEYIAMTEKPAKAESKEG